MSYLFVSEQVGKVQVDKLTSSYCNEHIVEILKLINTIPYIHWTANELLSHNEDFYGNKWNYSYAVKNKENKIIGILVAYFRLADNKHIFDSLYIHRFAIDPEYQNIGIGTEVLKYFTQKSFAEIPWLLNISVQTNNNFENEHVIRFYRKVGFKDMYNVTYSNKKDILLLLERKFYTFPHTNHIDKDRLNLRHPRYNVLADDFEPKSILPVIHFSSTNEKKKEIVRFIFNNYNIDVAFVKTKLELIEPQIENAEEEEEKKLVSLPLKNISRFININSMPYVIEDTMLFVEFFNRNGDVWELPGHDTKRWLRQIGLDGLLEIMNDTNRRKAKFVSQTGAYIGSSKYLYGRGELFGSIAYHKTEIITPKYGTYPYFFHLLFIPDGANKTLAEMDMHEYAQYDYMRKSIIQLINKLSSEIYPNIQYTLFDYLYEE